MGAREAIAELEFAEAEAAKVAPEAAFVVDVLAALPSGDGLTASELRVDYLMEKLSDEAKRLEAVEEFTARRVQMVRDHGEAETAKIAKRMAWLESKIREHLPLDAAGFRKHYGAKSHRLPHGQVGYRKHPATVEIVDFTEAMTWARENGVQPTETIKVTLPKAAILEWIKLMGEMPPENAIRYVDATDEFFVSPDLGF